MIFLLIFWYFLNFLLTQLFPITRQVFQKSWKFINSIILNMMYEDFKILNDDQYNLISEQLQNQKICSQAEIANKLFLTLDQCKSFCFGLNNQVNKRIQNALLYARNQLDKLINNVNISFNIDAHSMQIVTDLNIFAFAKKLIEAVQTVEELLHQPNSEKFSHFSLPTISTLLDIINQLFDALENSNIHLFKHM